MNLRTLAVGVALSSLLVASRARADAPTTPPAPPATAGTKVTTHFTQADPEEVFNELSKQSGVKFVTNNSNFWDQESMQLPIDAEFNDLPFWEAVKSVCIRLNLQLQPDWNGNGGGRRLQFQQGNGSQWNALPFCSSQGFYVQAVAYQRQQSVNFGQENPSAGNNSYVQLKVYVDPGIRVQSFIQQAKTELAKDDAGNDWTPPQADRGNGGYNNQRSLIFDCQAPLKFPEKQGKKLAQLKCTIQLRGSEKVDTLAVDKPLAAAETSKSFGGTTVTFQSLKKTPDGRYEAKLMVTREDENFGGDIWGLLQGAQLTDESGKLFRYGGGGGGGGGNGVYEYTLYYNAPGNSKTEPAKWSIEVPKDVHIIRVPVEFKDLPLP